jgi:hypothetical protein
MGITGFTRARDRLVGVLEAEADMATVLEESVAALHSLTRFTWRAVMPVDPQTLLPAGGVVEGFSPESCAPFWDNELLVPGFNKFNVLARSTEPVVTLSDATDGDLRRAPIYTDLWEPLGVADELRVAFLVGTTCWAVASFLRTIDDGPFPDHDRRPGSRSRAVHRPSDQGGRVQARRRSARTRGNHRARSRQPGPARHHRRRRDAGRPTHQRCRRTRPADPGRRRRDQSAEEPHVDPSRHPDARHSWLRVTAAPMEGDDGHVAVVIEPARLPE